MLRYRRVTVDAVEGGTVTVDAILRDSGRGMSWRPFGKREREGPFGENPKEYQEDYEKWMCRYLPWTSLRIRDCEGDWHTVWVNVDTGFNGDLSLPPGWVSRLGLRLPNECEIETVNGPLPAQSGEVEVIWKGKRRLIESIRRNCGAPPLIGMKLLKGNSITIDFQGPAGRDIYVDIKPIPESGSSMERFLRSFATRLRS